MAALEEGLFLVEMHPDDNQHREIELLFSRRAGPRGLEDHFKAIGLRRPLQPDVVRRVVAVDGIGARCGWPRNGRSTCWSGSYYLPPCAAGQAGQPMPPGV